MLWGRTLPPKLTLMNRCYFTSSGSKWLSWININRGTSIWLYFFQNTERLLSTQQTVDGILKLQLNTVSIECHGNTGEWTECCMLAKNLYWLWQCSHTFSINHSAPSCLILNSKNSLVLPQAISQYKQKLELKLHIIVFYVSLFKALYNCLLCKSVCNKHTSVKFSQFDFCAREDKEADFKGNNLQESKGQYSDLGRAAQICPQQVQPDQPHFLLWLSDEHTGLRKWCCLHQFQ